MNTITGKQIPTRDLDYEFMLDEADYVEQMKLRLCPTCGATMIPAGKHAYICPNQADQGNGISAELRAGVRADAAQRVDSAPF